MKRVANKEQREEARKTAVKRYQAFGINPDLENKSLMLYHTTADGLNYHVVMIDKEDSESDDIAALLERAMHDIVDLVSYQTLDDALYAVMGLSNTVDEEDEENTYIDLGYSIPGLIDIAQYV